MSGQQLSLILDLPTSFAMMSRRSIFFFIFLSSLGIRQLRSTPPIQYLSSPRRSVFFLFSSHNTDESTYSSYSRCMNPISSSPPTYSLCSSLIKLLRACCRLHLLKARCNVVESSIIARFDQQRNVTLIWTNRISSVFWVSKGNSSLCCTILL
jgi:hypothetical protein